MVVFNFIVIRLVKYSDILSSLIGIMQLMITKPVLYASLLLYGAKLLCRNESILKAVTAQTALA